jgi:hypothetical protein
LETFPDPALLKNSPDATIQPVVLRRPERLWRLGLTLALAFDLLFWGLPLGVNVPLFTLLLLLGATLTAASERRRPALRHVWLWGVLLLLAVMVAVRANAFLTFLNVTTLLMLLPFLAHFYSGGRLSDLGWLSFISLPAVVGGSALLGAPVSLTGDLQRGRAHAVPGRWRRFLPLLRGVLLALPALLIFGLLLAAADVLFADLLRSLFAWLSLPRLVELGVRTIFVSLLGWGLTGGLVYLARRRDDGRDRALQPVLLPGQVRGWLGYVEAVVVMGAVNVLFALFVGVQFVYLFGGARNIARDGFTYADYARRGFAEIVVVAVLSLLLILALNSAAGRSTKRQQWVFNLLCTLQIGFVLIMLVSAFQRLLLYETAFGLTHRRLVSHVFMVWLGVALLWTIVVVWRRPEAFVAGAFACGLGFVLTLNLLNPDLLIARANVARWLAAPALVDETDPYSRTTVLDVVYLSDLSDDAVVFLTALQPRLTGTAAETLGGELLRRYERYEDSAAPTPWPGQHLAHSRARRALENWMTQSGYGGS